MKFKKVRFYRTFFASLSSRRAWIEIVRYAGISIFELPSLSSRRAWIEIYLEEWENKNLIGSLSSRRAWIEIDLVHIDNNAAEGRSPHGERGLKYC